jgi:hypothetical protein
MATITTATVDPQLAADGLTATAAFTVIADAAGTASVVVKDSAGTTVGSDSRSGAAGSTIYLNVGGLATGANFTAQILESDDAGTVFGYAAGVGVNSDGLLSFPTPAQTGPADAVSVRLSASTTTLSQPVTLFVSASASGSSVGGREIDFSIHNGDDRGTFTPDKGTTIANQETPIVFTPSKRGKAQIQILVDKASKNADVIVN